MTDWIDFALYGIFLAVFWFLFPVTVSRAGLVWVADRNADWLSQHPEVAANLGKNRTYVRTCFVLGGISLALLTACQIGFWPRALSAPEFAPEHWMVLKELNTLLVLPALAVHLGSSYLFGRWLRTVPLTTQRSASLIPRSIDDLIPKRIRVATYVAVVAHLAAWLGAGAWLTYASPELWARNLAQFGGAALVFLLTHAIFLWFTRVNVNRRPNALDRIFGDGYRRHEVRAAFAFNWLPPITGTLRLLEELGNTAFDFGRLSHLGIVLAVLLLFAVGVAVFRPRGLMRAGERTTDCAVASDTD
jgi:hypothetical protein